MAVGTDNGNAKKLQSPDCGAQFKGGCNCNDTTLWFTTPGLDLRTDRGHPPKIQDPAVGRRRPGADRTSPGQEAPEHALSSDGTRSAVRAPRAPLSDAVGTNHHLLLPAPERSADRTGRRTEAERSEAEEFKLRTLSVAVDAAAAICGFTSTSNANRNCIHKIRHICLPPSWICNARRCMTSAEKPRAAWFLLPAGRWRSSSQD